MLISRKRKKRKNEIQLNRRSQRKTTNIKRTESGCEAATTAASCRLKKFQSFDLIPFEFASKHERKIACAVWCSIELCRFLFGCGCLNQALWATLNKNIFVVVCLFVALSCCLVGSVIKWDNKRALNQMLWHGWLSACYFRLFSHFFRFHHRLCASNDCARVFACHWKFVCRLKEKRMKSK